MNAHWWQRKLVALLHDPPDKVLDIPGHEERSKELRKFALHGLPDVQPTNIPSKWVDAAKRADTIASAADRLNFPKGTLAPSDCIIHPLSAQKASLHVESQKSSKAQAEVVKALSQKTNDPKKRFLLFWRCLEEELAKNDASVPWSLLPADTRIPDHPLLHHARVTSAFANCPEPATLVFTIGPVQSFISSARKTRDLWMGSFLLSYLTWHAIKVIAEKLGPDHVIYPSLLYQPLVDYWLYEKRVLSEKPSPEQLRLATLPNRFFAIVPAEQAEDLAKQAEEAVRNEWRRLAEQVWEEIRQKVPEFEASKTIWERQLEQFPEVYWAIYKWDETAQKIAERYQQLTGSDRFVKWLKEAKGAYEPNLGSVYDACYELTEKALGARKALRNFNAIEEPAGKCSICGERQVLSDLGEQIEHDWWNKEKEFWQKVAKNFPGDIAADGRERLCAICTIKRFAAKFVFEKDLNIPTEFPSTDSIAAANFVETLFERWKYAKAFVAELLERIDKNKDLEKIARGGMDIPKLKKTAVDGVAEKLLEFDGEWLFTESYDPERLKRVHGIGLRKEGAEGLKEILRKLYEAVGIQPTDYYAVLFMDGDEMGKWLSGTHEGLPKFAEILHAEVREQLAHDSQRQQMLETRRLMSPSLHASISMALANFALNFVPFVVEELYAGRLVYAGGDDVLALLPLRDALPAAHKLRALFSGEAELRDKDVFVELGGQKWTGWVDWQGRQLLTMGNRATASVGIVVAHRLHPLHDVLRQGQEAEKNAKKHYGRNAICIRWLKRSGEQVQMGAKFSYPEQGINDTLQLLLDFAELMRDKIARGFASDLMRESFMLAELERKAQEAEIKRLLLRRKKPGLSEKEAEDWAKKLACLANALDTHADSKDPFDMTRPQAGIVELAKWLTFLRFLAGGEYGSSGT
ncbi:MAG: CRISPR-associated protein Cmr2 [Archaeoglobaceae archaeon]|nr:CRISPR-associated protein Cmr2 [Archaeoglobaceae archaeon]MDK2876253.1 CRISPR-associated protein Cmr2 [Archaeoglobaceae archaeon]